MITQNYTAAEKKTAEKIARFLAGLPDETWLLLCDTKEQMNHWLAYREFNQLVSQAWKALHRGKNDPLLPMLQKGEISGDAYDLAWLTADFYQSLWALIQISFHYIQPELKRLGVSYLPSSASDLLTWILYNESYDEFHLCLKPYHEVSTGKLAKTTGTMSKAFEGAASPIEIRNLEKSPMGKIESNILLGIIARVCQDKATRTRPTLKARLEAFYTATVKVNNFLASVHRDHGSYAWVEGRRVKGSRYGGTYQNA